MRARRRSPRIAWIVVAVVVSCLAESRPGAAQHPTARAGSVASAELSTEARRFVDATVAATRRFADRSEAIRAGYRKLGPDFPGMGEHWVHPGRIVQGTLDPSYPPVLSYVGLETGAVLVGVAFTLPLGPDEEPPVEPFGEEVWHDHSGAVDEETLLLNHPSTMHSGGSGHRLSMVHVWTDLENPDGVLAQNNWRLPWVRVGLEPPQEASVDAARGVSLGFNGRAFYGTLISRAASLTAEEDAAVERVLETYASRVEAGIVEAGPGRSGEGIEPEAFARLWWEFWDSVRESVGDESWARLAPLAGRAHTGEGPRDS